LNYIELPVSIIMKKIPRPRYIGHFALLKTCAIF